MIDFAEILEPLRKQLEQDTQKFLKEKVNSLIRNPDDPKTEDDGLYSYDCKECGNEFLWGDSNGENKDRLCQACSQKRIAELEKEIVHRKKENKRLVFMVGGNTMNCDVCGKEYEPTRKIVKVRRSFCPDHIPDDMREAQSLEFDDVPEIKGPRVSFSDKDVSRRSDSQQLRRSLEKVSKETRKECVWCGKLTAKKLYCSDQCRKEHEHTIENSVEVFANPFNCSMCGRKGSLCELHKGKQLSEVKND